MTGLALVVLTALSSIFIWEIAAGDNMGMSRDRRWWLGSHTHHFSHYSNTDESSQTGIERCSECIRCHCDFSLANCHNWRVDCLQYTMTCNAGDYHEYGLVTPWSSWVTVNGQCGQMATRQRHRSCDRKNCAKECREPLLETIYIWMPPCQAGLPNPTSTMTAVTKTTIPSLTSAPASHQCDKLCAITAVANGNSYQLATAPVCPDTTHRSPEAMIEQCCTTFGPVTWKKGTNVMGGCGRTPHYAPVGRFDYGFYQPGSAGIFLECSQDGTTGFMMALQTCNDPPTLLHVTNNGTTKLDHPELYYFIV